MHHEWLLIPLLIFKQIKAIQFAVDWNTNLNKGHEYSGKKS